MLSSLIEFIDAIAVLDSRGRPTVRATVHLNDGSIGTATAPSGPLLSKHECVEMRDNGSAFSGLGVERAVETIRRRIAPALRGYSALDQSLVDRTLVDLDGTPLRANLGVNAMVAVSMAVCRAGAAVEGIPLWKHLLQREFIGSPIPIFTLLSVAPNVDSALRVQEILAIPHGPSAESERVRCGAEVYATLAGQFDQLHMDTAVGNEGGLILRGGNLTLALTLACDAIDAAGYKPGVDVSLGIEAGANSFRNDDETYSPELGPRLSSSDLFEWWRDVVHEYPVALIEDPFADDDFEGWWTITHELGKQVIIAGDDLFTTNADRIAHGIRNHLANAVILKPNQIGTVTETIHAWRTAHAAEYRSIVSHRAGESVDTFIADLAFGLGSDYLKAGAPARAERTEKYNRLLEIEREAGSVRQLEAG